MCSKGPHHTLTNPFLEKFYRKLKKLSKLFEFLIKFFPKIVYHCVPLGHILVKFIYKIFIFKISKIIKDYLMDLKIRSIVSINSIGNFLSLNKKMSLNNKKRFHTLIGG